MNQLVRVFNPKHDVATVRMIAHAAIHYKVKRGYTLNRTDHDVMATLRTHADSTKVHNVRAVMTSCQIQAASVRTGSLTLEEALTRIGLILSSAIR